MLIPDIGKVHIDYSLKGVRDAARYLRKDIKAMAQPALDAEDAGEPAPRYAMYSVWVSQKHKHYHTYQHL